MVPSCAFAAQISLPSGETSNPSAPPPTLTTVSSQSAGGGPSGPPGRLGAPGGGPPGPARARAFPCLLDDGFSSLDGSVGQLLAAFTGRFDDRRQESFGEDWLTSGEFEGRLRRPTYAGVEVTVEGANGQAAQAPLPARSASSSSSSATGGARRVSYSGGAGAPGAAALAAAAGAEAGSPVVCAWRRSAAERAG